MDEILQVRQTCSTGSITIYSFTLIVKLTEMTEQKDHLKMIQRAYYMNSDVALLMMTQ